ncbi:MAG: hypothetical protein AAF801_18480 [Pseudomonadota bacterium]
MKSLLVAISVLLSCKAFPTIGAAQNTDQGAAGSYECAVHLMARAMWMYGLDGRPEMIEMMVRYSNILWQPDPYAPRMPIYGMRQDYFERAHENEILRVLTGWAKEGHGHEQRPICAEDTKCVQCLAVLKATVIAQD